MKAIEKMKHRVIDQILLVRDEDLLSEIDFLLRSKKNDEVVHLNELEVDMLKMGLNDIEQGNTHSEEALERDDLEWLK